MKRIFLSLSVVSAALLGLALVLGLMIGDPASRDMAEQTMVRNHFFASVGGVVFALMLHAIALTYFMGTGRWMEETCRAYRLDDDFRKQNQTLKYRMLPWMMLSLAMLLATAAFGGAADPASPVSFEGFAGLSAAASHYVLAVAAIGAHAIACLVEYLAIDRNAELIDDVMKRVRAMRLERGLSV